MAQPATLAKSAMVMFDDKPDDALLARALALLARGMDDLGAVDQTFITEWNSNYTRYIAKAVGR